MLFHKDEVDLGSLEPLGESSLRQHLVAPIPWLLLWGSSLGCYRVFFPWVRRLVLSFFVIILFFIIITLCKCVLTTTVLIIDYVIAILIVMFNYILVLLQKFLKGKKLFKKKFFIKIFFNFICSKALINQSCGLY